MTASGESHAERTDPVGLAAAAYRDRVAIMRSAGMAVDPATWPKQTSGLRDAAASLANPTDDPAFTKEP